MSYLDTYKRKMKFQGGSAVNANVKDTKVYIDMEFKNDPSYKLAMIDFDKSNKVDSRFMESKSNTFKKYFLFRPDYIIKDGSYITTEQGTFIIESHTMKDLYPKAEALYCNFKIITKIQSDFIYAHANDTAYGTKGIQDNGYFKEQDSRLRIWIKANDITKNYYEGMRFLVRNESIHISEKDEFMAYEVTKKSFSVTSGLYILETIVVPLSPLDDLKNGIAYNEKFENERPVESYEILGLDKIRVGQIGEYKVEPENLNVIYELDYDIYAQIFEQYNGICKIKGLKNKGIVTLSAKLGQDIISTKDIIVY